MLLIVKSLKGGPYLQYVLILWLSYYSSDTWNRDFVGSDKLRIGRLPSDSHLPFKILLIAVEY